MPRRSLTLRAAAVLAAATLGAGLTACADTTRIPPAPNDTGAAEPLFASDEEALAAAVEAYEEYLIVADAVLATPGEGGVDPSTVAMDSALEQLLEAEQRFLDQRLQLAGGRSIENMVAQQLPQRLGDEIGIFYVCEDVTGTDLLDGDGESLVGDERETLTAWEVVLELGNGPYFERVAERTFWNGAGIC